MCSGIICGLTTVVIGTALVVASTLVGYYVIPDIIERSILNEVLLLNDTIQMERFETIPFPLNFRVRVFNITNRQEVLEGSIPNMQEIGPYVYKLYHHRVIEHMEHDKLSYRILLEMVFDSEASFPLTEDDIVYVANVPYHGVLQVAQAKYPGLMGVLNLAMNGIFGDMNSPIAATRVGDLLIDGIDICHNAGLVGNAACSLIRTMSEDIQNMELQPDNSIKFSMLSYRVDKPGRLFTVYRGIEDHANLARITSMDGLPNLSFWAKNDDGSPTDCNMINGTDSGLFAPFIDRSKSMYALNTDICRSVELRYQYDVVYEGIPAARFSANEWFLDNDEGCFCLNVTAGVTNPQGCLLRGAMELYSCVGAYMALSYPHFLYADLIYRNGVTGMTPHEENHRIFIDLELHTGTVVRGAKRAQFNVFMRPVDGIPATQNLRTTLTPVIWIEEGIELSEEYVDILSSNLLATLNLVNILVPIAVALSGVVLISGIVAVLCIRFNKKTTV